MENKTDKKGMKVEQGEYFTVADMSKELGESLETIKKRITRLGIKPLSRDALYEKSVLDILRNTPGKGRPKKESLPEKPEAKKSAVKPKGKTPKKVAK